jgi:hypothetical protein
MAYQDSQAQLGGTVAANGRPAVSGRVASGAGNGKVAKRDSDDIVAEIERTRQNLARTIDSLADRVSPASNARRVRERAAEQARRPEVKLAALAIALGATGFTIWRIWGRRRS